MQVTGQEVAFLECSSGLRSVSRQQSGGQGFITPYKLVQISMVSEKYHYGFRYNVYHQDGHLKLSEDMTVQAFRGMWRFYGV